MLFLYLTGVLLWLAYGIQVHAAAVVWANGLAVVLVVVSIVLKANTPANKLEADRGGCALQWIWTKSLPILSANI